MTTTQMQQIPIADLRLASKCHHSIARLTAEGDPQWNALVARLTATLQEIRTEYPDIDRHFLDIPTLCRPSDNHSADIEREDEVIPDLD